MAFRKIKAGLVNADVDLFVGEVGNLFFDITTGELRLSNGVDPGGVVVSGGSGGSDYTLPTSSTTTKGGVKVDGTTITINNQIISATQQDLSSYATQTYVTTRGYITSSALSGYATETFVTTRGYITSVGTISYTDLSNKPTLFSGSYTDLTNKPTIPTLTSQLSNDSNFIANLTDTRLELSTYVANLRAPDNISIQANGIGWTFRQDGKLQFPDSTFQTTAYVPYTLPTASSLVLGGVKIGSNISINAGVISVAAPFSGSYTDLTNKPTIPAAQIQSDWTQSNNASLDFIKNKPTIPTTVTVNGTSITLGSSGTVTAAAGTLTGTTLNSTVVSSSLTSVGTLTGLTVNSSSSTAVSITADGRPGSETNNWSFVSNQSIGGPRAWIQFPDSTLQTTAYTGNATTATKLATARAINGVDFDGSAAITITAAAGTLSGSTLASGVTASSLTSVGTLTSLTSTGSVTANHTTAFIAGDAAISNIALQIPREGAIRNLYNGANNMYFDVSIGGTTQGAFQFRSSSSYTNVLTMSSTGVTFNTDATVTARTASLARTAFNAAIDTEITVDEMRFRISNASGIFPQVIGNGSSRNLAWTGIGAISGSAVTQLGSTGTIVSSSAWTTLYNGHGMDSAGDTVTVTLQDKAASRIYRITFMRSDNGSTTGYNIIAERLL